MVSSALDTCVQDRITLSLQAGAFVKTPSLNSIVGFTVGNSRLLEQILVQEL